MFVRYLNIGGSISSNSDTYCQLCDFIIYSGKYRVDIALATIRDKTENRFCNEYLLPKLRSFTEMTQAEWQKVFFMDSKMLNMASFLHSYCLSEEEKQEDLHILLDAESIKTSPELAARKYSNELTELFSKEIRKIKEDKEHLSIDFFMNI